VRKGKLFQKNPAINEILKLKEGFWLKWDNLNFLRTLTNIASSSKNTLRQPKRLTSIQRRQNLDTRKEKEGKRPRRRKKSSLYAVTGD